ncbi:Fungal-trans domain-containing protein [Mycena kentingensis (nom. inval.)]|nr:Fungal-trans domain-containing protein [Mycena kentingensis (nom. inval.)]
MASTAPKTKRRRLPNACDICRRQKARCDSAEMPNGICSNCLAFNSKCTHSYVKDDTKARSNFNVVPQRTAQEHISVILSGSQEYTSGDYQVLVAVAQYARRLEEAFSVTTTLPGPSGATAEKSASPESDSSATLFTPEESSTSATSSDGRLQLNDGVLFDKHSVEPIARPMARHVANNRFYGKSSTINFVKALMQFKMETTGDKGVAPQVEWARPEFWSVRAWEMPQEIYVPQIFPDPDLFDALIDLYFCHINPIVYVLHEKTFRNDVSIGLHLVDQQFGAVVLGVCAVGSKLSDDPRVLLDGTNGDLHSAGWQWWSQVRPIPVSFVESASLYQLQLVVLAAFYLGSSSTPESCWTIIGAGIRMGTDVGAHTRIRSGAKTVEAELYKRVFFALIVADAIMSALLGRPKAAPWSDVDLDYVVALEGEEEDVVASYTTQLLKLMHIRGQIQSVVNSNTPLERPQEIVAELDSALNQWAEAIPEQLRWDPNQPNRQRLNQSALLYVTYYHSQIHLHRPFIQPKQPSFSSTTFPSFAICWNAARSVGHVMEMQTKNGLGLLWGPHVPSTIFDAATVLLLGSIHRSRPTTDQNVERCLNVLRLYEKRWHVAGRLVDILVGMLEVGKTPSLKRTRGDDTPDTLLANSEPGAIIDFSPANLTPQNLFTPPPDALATPADNQFYMPVLTEDLGRLPTDASYADFDADSLLFYPDVFTTLHAMPMPPGEDAASALIQNDFMGGRLSTSWADWGSNFASTSKE